MNLASIPSPANGVWHLGPVPIRAYALCIIVGVIAAVIIGERRWQARGGRRGTVTDVAAIGVPFGLVGGRLYHVITSPENYFGSGGDPIKILYIWEGGLGIYGAILLGGVGAWLACRRRGVQLPAFGDAVAPGIAVAQAIGRFGNYFNQELFGRPTNLPWGLKIEQGRDGTVPGHDTYHPTFLYESLWCLGIAGVVVWVDRRYKLGHGRVFALYIALYAVGRAWIEALRADTANHLFGLRVNLWTCLVVFVGAVAWFVTHGGPREENVEAAPATDAPTDGTSSEKDVSTEKDDASGEKEKVSVKKDTTKKERVSVKKDHSGEKEKVSVKKDHSGEKEKVSVKKDHSGEEEKVSVKKDHSGEEEKASVKKDHSGEKGQVSVKKAASDSEGDVGAGSEVPSTGDSDS